jgi:hypothetical protein
MHPSQSRIIPIYKSNGELGGYLVYPYLYNNTGEWIGWVTNDRQVYSVLGFYVGNLTNDPRIVRRMSEDERPRKSPPPKPAVIKPPVSVPLAPMMSDLPFGITDILLDEPERLHTRDTGDMMQDMD